LKRQIVTIDERLCDGCGLCIPNCHEGALQLIDGKARLISDLFCDGLGACLGHCPQGAITLEEREAEPYDEVRVMELMMEKGNNTVVAHLQHLLDHGEALLLDQAAGVLREQRYIVEVAPGQVSLLQYLRAQGVLAAQVQPAQAREEQGHPAACGCQGSAPVDLGASRRTEAAVAPTAGDLPSELQNWPIQMHLINPGAGYFQGADLLVAADCTAFSLGAFHRRMMKGKSVVIACPKLDDGKDRYLQKFVALIDQAGVNTITVAMMEVPCCGGLLQMLQMARERASRKVPLKKIIIGIRGDILEESWT